MATKKYNPFPELCKNGPLIAAHRGVGGGYIPCNTQPAFDAAIASGADIIECDVIKSYVDDSLFIFHRKMDAPHLGRLAGDIRNLPEAELQKICYINQDHTQTEYRLLPLEEALMLMKGRAFINLDHAWYHFPETMAVVRKCGVEKQILLKSAPKPEYLADIEKYAPDIPFMPIIKKPEDLEIMAQFPDINYIGVEAVFADMDSPFATREFIDQMHAEGKIVWANAIIYNHKKQLAAGHTDDVSVIGTPEAGWGWLRDMQYDIIQTDWPAQLKMFLMGMYPIGNRVSF